MLKPRNGKFCLNPWIHFSRSKQPPHSVWQTRLYARKIKSYTFSNILDNFYT